MKDYKTFINEEGENGGEPTNVSGQNDNPDVPLGKKKKKKKKEEVDEEREPDQTNPKMKGKRNSKMRGDNPNSEGDDVKRDEEEVKESKDYTNKTYKYFEMFLKREGWSDEDIKWESEFFRNALKISPDMREREIKDLYFTTVRRGSKKRLNRKDKIGIVLTFANASNHASVG